MTTESPRTSPVTICLHHNDPDGRCSAAIVRRALGSQVSLHEMNYGDPIPWDTIEACQQVLVVDFSLPLADMQRIRQSAELIWIDHHKTALESLAVLGDLPGLRGLEEAACVLTWRTFFPDQPVPAAVAYVGDRDIWRFTYANTKPFCEGLYQEETDPANDALWEPLLDGDESLIADLIDRGAILYAARLRKIARVVDRRGFRATFEGHRTLVVNARGSGDMGAYIREQGNEIAYCYNDAVQNGKLTTFVTMYSGKVDVSEIAARFGGGGHAGAAGFSFERRETPFPEKARVEM